MNLYGTRETVKDLTDLRHLLGIKQWNLHGVSYGTRLALSVMRDAPEGVRSVILDSPYPPEVHAYEIQAAGVELAFEKLFKACAKNNYCRRRYPNLERAIFEQIEWLNIRPLPVTVTDPRNGEPVTIEVTGKALVEITRWALAFTDARYALPHYLAAISSVDPAVLEPAVRGMVDGYLGLGSGDMSEGKYYAVECIEEIPFNDPVLVRELEKKHHRFAGFGYKLDEMSACDAWPEGDAGRQPEGADQEQHPDSGVVGRTRSDHAGGVWPDDGEPPGPLLSDRGSRPRPLAVVELQMRRGYRGRLPGQPEEETFGGLPEEGPGLIRRAGDPAVPRGGPRRRQAFIGRHGFVAFLRHGYPQPVRLELLGGAGFRAD